MQIFNKDPNFDFLKLRKFAIVLSAILIIGSIVSIATRGINFGLDFTGGTLVEAGFEQDADLDKVRGQLLDINIKGAVVQEFGSSKVIHIRMPEQDAIQKDSLPNGLIAKLNLEEEEITNVHLADIVVGTLASDGTAVDKRDQAYIGPAVGEELKEQGGLGMLVALICIMLYVALRFEWKFSVGSVAALAHDVVITLGFFSITQMNFDLTVLAALLAVIGYSLNDTIVVFDRIRENFIRMRKGDSTHVINTSLNQTLSRTLMTSLTTLLVLVSLFVFGGEAIHAFATALIVGVFIGTYSSVYVASTVALALGVQKEDLMPPEVEKEGAEFDMP